MKPSYEPNPVTFLRGRLAEEKDHPAVPSKIFWSELRRNSFGFDYAPTWTVHTLFAVKI